MKKIYASKGFTLIEALVAVLVLSIGLLGVAAMQLKALQSAHVSYQRSIATIAAQDAANRLWVELGHHSAECPADDNDLDHINDWGAEWGVHFNTLDVTPVNFGGSDNCEYKVTIGWADERFVVDGNQEDVSTLIYVIKLPGK